MAKEIYKELLEKTKVAVLKQVQLADGYYVLEDIFQRITAWFIR
ncbi:hypothetical protein [Saccharolobus shibatae]|uniref:Uncharacterized protein n=1 Tax=Saccharolobus shibatae TaxID=2286 RepID=A0A8F5BV90_9CREN|nr:hypothetical protein [Saccharolobus shibatae]QXJ32103.1 hypothetical protein J5U21_01754 [Saccharolobus shibatae]